MLPGITGSVVKREGLCMVLGGVLQAEVFHQL